MQSQQCCFVIKGPYWCILCDSKRGDNYYWQANSSKSKTKYFSDTVCWQVWVFCLFCFVCTFGCSWFWIFGADGEPSHQDLESGRERQCPKIPLWSLNASCFYCTWSCGRPTASHTLTLGFIIVFISPNINLSSPNTHTCTIWIRLLWMIETDCSEQGTEALISPEPSSDPPDSLPKK